MAEQDRRGARQPPADGVRERRNLNRGRTPEQREDKLRSPSLDLSRAFRLRLGVPLDGVRGQAVDVGEDRLGEPRGGRLVDSGLLGCRREPSPGDPGANAVCGLQGVERSPRAQLRAPEAHRCPPAAVVDRIWVTNEYHEAPQCFVDARAQRFTERALERLRVLGHLVGDRHEDLAG